MVYCHDNERTHYESPGEKVFRYPYQRGNAGLVPYPRTAAGQRLFVSGGRNTGNDPVHAQR